ncbi:hypothetical protein CWE13_05655 [Aliidiomarina shirensis]|uniref:Uncharacterized protein n=1 Tax=Aliidiomarina shirensis TaxID=1048642 RepID=A0A432WUK6_9GAMM|nr:hypothetical protein CWE13_05655 [Aliidiomarina shirensis]
MHGNFLYWQRAGEKFAGIIGMFASRCNQTHAVLVSERFFIRQLNGIYTLHGHVPYGFNITMEIAEC